jgi:hypothetical protein
MMYGLWQMPMYHLEFELLEVPAQRLEAERDANLWGEIGASGY